MQIKLSKVIRLKLFFKIIILFLPKILFGQLLINELCSKGSVSDRFNNNCDWVELINYSDSNLTISNYYISDNSDNLLKWTLPRQILTPMEKILILCSRPQLLLDKLTPTVGEKFCP